MTCVAPRRIWCRPHPKKNTTTTTTVHGRGATARARRVVQVGGDGAVLYGGKAVAARVDLGTEFAALSQRERRAERRRHRQQQRSVHLTVTPHSTVTPPL